MTLGPTPKSSLIRYNKVSGSRSYRFFVDEDTFRGRRSVDKGRESREAGTAQIKVAKGRIVSGSNPRKTCVAS